jgi:hypothetical protein
MNLPTHLNTEFIINLIVLNIMQNDGLTIEGLIEELTDRKANYLEDSIWEVDGKQCCSKDVELYFREALGETESKELVRIAKQHKEPRLLPNLLQSDSMSIDDTFYRYFDIDVNHVDELVVFGKRDHEIMLTIVDNDQDTTFEFSLENVENAIYDGENLWQAECLQDDVLTWVTISAYKVVPTKA